MSFCLRCPKCASSNVETNTDKNPLMYGSSGGLTFKCRACGKTLYGASVQALVQSQYAAWEALPKPTPVPLSTVSPRALQEEEAAIYLRKLLAKTAAYAHRIQDQVHLILTQLGQVRFVNKRTEGEGNLLRIDANGILHAATHLPQSLDELRKVRDRFDMFSQTADVRMANIRRKALEDARSTVVAPKIAPKIAVKVGRTLQDPVPCAWKDCDKTVTGASKYCCREHSNMNARYQASLRVAKDKPMLTVDAMVGTVKAVRQPQNAPQSRTLDEMSRAQLREFAKARSISGWGHKTPAELREMIKSHLDVDQPAR